MAVNLAMIRIVQAVESKSFRPQFARGKEMRPQIAFIFEMIVLLEVKVPK